MVSNFPFQFCAHRFSSVLQFLTKIFMLCSIYCLCITRGWRADEKGIQEEMWDNGVQSVPEQKVRPQNTLSIWERRAGNSPLSTGPRCWDPAPPDHSWPPLEDVGGDYYLPIPKLLIDSQLTGFRLFLSNPFIFKSKTNLMAPTYHL